MFAMIFAFGIQVNQCYKHVRGHCKCQFSLCDCARFYVLFLPVFLKRNAAPLRMTVLLYMDMPISIPLPFFFSCSAPANDRFYLARLHTYCNGSAPCLRTSSRGHPPPPLPPPLPKPCPSVFSFYVPMTIAVM